jgi:hypothetical protein
MASFEVGNEPGRTLKHGYLGPRALTFQQERVHGDFTETGIGKIKPVAVRLPRTNTTSAASSCFEKIGL